MQLKTVLAVVFVAVVMYVLHRLALWAEDHGWIYYRKGRGRNWSVGAAAQELQSLLQPSSKHVVEESRREALERHDAEDPSDH